MRLVTCLSRHWLKLRLPSQFGGLCLRSTVVSCIKKRQILCCCYSLDWTKWAQHQRDRGLDWGKDGGWRVCRPNMHLNESGTQQTKAVNPDARRQRRDQGLGPLIFRSCPLQYAAEEEMRTESISHEACVNIFKLPASNQAGVTSQLFPFPPFV